MQENSRVYGDCDTCENALKCDRYTAFGINLLKWYFGCPKFDEGKGKSDGSRA